MAEQGSPELLSKTQRREILWRTIRTDFVENGIDIRELPLKYKVGRTAVYTRAKRGNWRELRQKFVNSPETETELSVADRRDRLIKWLRSTTETLTIRAMQLINDEAERSQITKEAKNAADRFTDTVEKVRERVAMMKDLDALRKSAFGEVIEVIEHDMVYNVEVNEQRPRVRIVRQGESRREDPVIDIPAEEVEELGLIISPRNVVTPKNGEPGEDET